jgi:hypothetical protein
VANLDDYEVVRGLVSEFISEGVGALVTEATRETVLAVRDLKEELKNIRVKDVADKLDLDKSTTGRRVRKAISQGYLQNLEEKKHRPYKLDIDAPLPEEVEILPAVARLRHGITGVATGVQPGNRGNTGG